MARRTLLLVSPPVLYARSWWANRLANKPHLASLAGVVRELADVHVLELDIEALSADDAAGGLDPLAPLDDALTEDVGLVGLSCWTSLHYLGTLAVAERVRARLPDVPIVVGGHHATALPSDFTSAHCDFLVRGDGEGPLRALCEEWPARPAELRVLAGGVFDQSDPSHIDWVNYGRPGAKERALWVGTSRGCAFQCRFCVEPQRGASYSRYSVADTLAILERLVETHGPRVVAFSDPLFGAQRRWTEELLAGLEERRLPLMFWAQTRADLMSRELLDGFLRCGFMVDFGLDTASAEMIVRMDKSANPERYLSRYREVLAHADAIGLAHGVYLVFNFPGETPETTAETQAFVDSLGAGGGPASGWLSSQTFFILPGTDAYLRMAENAAAHGTEVRHPGWWREVGDHHALATDVLPSAAWRGREAELGAYRAWNEEVNQGWGTRFPAEVHRFRYAFYFA